MKSTANHLRDVVLKVLPLLKEISDKNASAKPTPEKWSNKEILGHLIDSACNNQQKFVRTMAQPHLNFVGYAQNHWVTAQHYQTVNWELLVDFWKSHNLHLAHVIENVDEAFLQNTISIEGVGPFTLAFIMKDYAEHLKHHLRQILPDIGLESTFQNVYGA
jgi:hypothetical protein